MVNSRTNLLSGVEKKCVSAELDPENKKGINFTSWNTAYNSSKDLPPSNSQKAKDACAETITCRHPESLKNGVRRVLMPEVTKEIAESIAKHNIDGITVDIVPITIKDFANSLVAQQEILLPKIIAQAEKFKEQETNETGSGFLYKGVPYLAIDPNTQKYVVIDGHHSWGAINLLLKDGEIDPDKKLNAVVFRTNPISAIKACFAVGAWSNPLDPSNYTNRPKLCSHKNNTGRDIYGSISTIYRRPRLQRQSMEGTRMEGSMGGRSRRTRRGRTRRGRTRRHRR